MRSHHLEIPKYDMPLRLRPVRRVTGFVFRHRTPLSYYSRCCLFTVVHRVHLPDNGGSSVLGVHELFALVTNQ